MADLAVTPISKAGTVQALAAAAAGGDTVVRHAGGFLVINNPTAGAITVTIDTPGTTHGLAIADEGIAVAAGATVLVPIDDVVFLHPEDQRIHLAYSAAGLLIEAFAL